MIYVIISPWDPLWSYALFILDYFLIEYFSFYKLYYSESIWNLEKYSWI